MFVYTHWNWDSEACKQKSSIIPVNKDDPYAFPQVDLGLALGPNTGKIVQCSEITSVDPNKIPVFQDFEVGEKMVCVGGHQNSI